MIPEDFNIFLYIHNLKQRKLPLRENYFGPLELLISESSLTYKVLTFFLKEIRVQLNNRTYISIFIGFQSVIYSTSIFPHFTNKCL